MIFAHTLWFVWCGVPIFAARRREGNRLFKKAGAPREFFAPALELMLYQKNLCSFCFLSCLLFKIRCIGFHSRKEPARKNTRARAGSFISFHQPLSNVVSKSLPPEPPRRATYPRRLLIKKFFISIIYLFQLSSINGRYFSTQKYCIQKHQTCQVSLHFIFKKKSRNIDPYFWTT